MIIAIAFIYVAMMGFLLGMLVERRSHVKKLRALHDAMWEIIGL